MRFREMRVRSGKTVLEVSRALKVSPQAVYYWEDETQFPSVKRLAEIAELYGCTVDDLLNPDTDGK